MKKGNKVISLEYLQKLVKKQEEKEERDRQIKYLNGGANEMLQIPRKDNQPYLQCVSVGVKGMYSPFSTRRILGTYFIKLISEKIKIKIKS